MGCRVQSRSDNISYRLLKCIIPGAGKMYTQAGVKIAHYFLSSVPLPRVPKQFRRGWCMLLQSLPLSYAPVCSCVCSCVCLCECVCNHNQHCSARAG